MFISQPHPPIDGPVRQDDDAPDRVKLKDTQLQPVLSKKEEEPGSGSEQKSRKK